MHAEEELLPPWAIKKSTGALEAGAQLCTRDGRKIGNGHIVRISQWVGKNNIEVYAVLTDAGQIVSLTAAEITTLFYPPKWVSDLREVLQKFSRT